MNVIKECVTNDIEGHTDVFVHEELLKQFAKEAIVIPDVGVNPVSNTQKDLLNKIAFSECEIFPFHHHEIDCCHIERQKKKRVSSETQFQQKALSFKQCQKLLVNAFGAYEDGRRPYPSAGALYPIEPLVFLFNENFIEEIGSGCYHFRSVSKKLQKIKSIKKIDFFSRLLHNLVDLDDAPNFVLLYVAHINKAIFKYRFRGYRHAMLEVGSMYQNAIEVGTQLNLASTVWSAFADYEILSALNLDPATFLPITMQFFGTSK